VRARTITISILDDEEDGSVAVEVDVPEGLTTVEAFGFMGIAQAQYLQGKHRAGPTVYQAPDDISGLDKM
jgi:hypothetical protein